MALTNNSKLKKWMDEWDKKQSNASKECKLGLKQKQFLQWFDEYQNSYIIAARIFNKINKNSEIKLNRKELKEVIPEIIECEMYLSSFKTILNNIKKVYLKAYKKNKN